MALGLVIVGVAACSDSDDDTASTQAAATDPAPATTGVTASEPTSAPAPTEPGATPTDPAPTNPATTTAATAPVDEGACSTTETGPIKVGNVGSYSGSSAATAGPVAEGVRMWADAVNAAGGICGRQVEVVVVDDGGDTARYATGIRDLVDNEDVVAFLAPAAVQTFAGGIEYHNESGVPVIGADGTMREMFASPVIAPIVAFSTDVVSNTIAGPIEVTGATKFGYVFCQEAQVCQDADELFTGGAVEAGGGELAYRAQISLAQVDFTAECQSAREAGVEMFTVLADPGTIGRVALACSRQDFEPAWSLPAGVVSAELMSQPGLSEAVITSGLFPIEGASSPAIDEFHAAAAESGNAIATGLANGWVSGKLFELVATRAAQATGTIDSASLVEALHTVAGETLGGLTTALTFTEAGAQHAPCGFLMQGDGAGGLMAPIGPDPICIGE